MPVTPEVTVTEPSSALRIISSTYEPDAVQGGALTRDEADRLIADIEANLRYAARESYCLDSIGQKTYHVALLSYEVDGATRWAVYTSDTDGDCHLDSADRQVADARYVEEVRQLADCADPGTAWWDHTDVEGVLDRSDIADDEDDEDEL